MEKRAAYKTHSISIALKSGSFWQFKNIKVEESSVSLSGNSGQPPLQTTGSHKTEFVFDVRQFGVLQRARLHFSTPTFTQSS